MESGLKFARRNENMEKWRLSDLPDELILKIFSSLPMFEETVATDLISRRWSEEDPWKLVSDVTLDDKSFMSFIYGTLLSNDAQTLERLHLRLLQIKSASDINFVVQVGVNLSVRKLRIDLFGRTLVLPSCLSTCTTLKSLILCGVSIDVFPNGFCLPSLKSLHLFSVKFSDYKYFASLLQSCPDLEYLVLNQTEYHDVDKVRLCLSSLKSLHLLSVGEYSVRCLLQSCTVLEYLVVRQTKLGSGMFTGARFCRTSLKSLHLLSVKFLSDGSVTCLLRDCKVLEDLVINRTEDDNVKQFNINVPTLRSLSINNSRKKPVYVEDIHGFVINAPALEKLSFKDTCSNYVMFEYMPEVTKANIEVKDCDQPEKFVGSLTSIQHLSFCSRTSKTPYPRGTFFFFLEHLELCTCSAGWANLLACILNDAPRLQSLKLKSHKHYSSQKHSAHDNDPMNLWIDPKAVPECFLKHLEILEWRQYEGSEQERKVAAYILASATCLTMATFSISSTCRHKYAELEEMSRVSETCQLVLEFE